MATGTCIKATRCEISDILTLVVLMSQVLRDMSQCCAASRSHCSGDWNTLQLAGTAHPKTSHITTEELHMNKYHTTVMTQPIRPLKKNCSGMSGSTVQNLLLPQQLQWLCSTYLLWWQSTSDHGVLQGTVTAYSWRERGKSPEICQWYDSNRAPFRCKSKILRDQTSFLVGLIFRALHCQQVNSWARGHFSLNSFKFCCLIFLISQSCD